MTTNTPTTKAETKPIATKKTLLFGSNQYKKTRIATMVTAFIGVIMAAIFPLLPVIQQSTVIKWPQQQTISNITAPLITQVPIKVSASIACIDAAALPPAGGLLYGTMPDNDPKSISRGLFVKATQTDIIILDRGVQLLKANRATAIKSNCVIDVSSDNATTNVSFTGYPTKNADGTTNPTSNDVANQILRPQVLGIYTDLPSTINPNTVHSEIKVDTRWETSPTLLKKADLVIGLTLIILSILLLYRLDRKERGPKKYRFKKPKITKVDITVVGILLVWLWMGANTSDDGYIFNMARNASASGYMINFFRWWGAAEDPWGWYYYILGIFLHIYRAAWMMRIPTFLMALGTWYLLSRKVIPRFGITVSRSRIALWSGAAGLLAVWLPLNNGLRPEPVVTICTIIAWCFMENAIATRKIAPLTLAVIAAAFSVGAAPGGIMTIGILVAGSTKILQRTRKRWQKDGLLTLVLPVLAAGLLYLFVGFIDQPLAVVLDGARAKTVAGPSLRWFDEPVRFFYLFRYPDVDASSNRRYAVLLTLLCALMVTIVIIRLGRKHGLAKGPVFRLLGLGIATLIAMTLTPTKWTHHFGCYAFLAGGFAAIAGGLLANKDVIKQAYKRTYFLAALLLVFALSFAGSNGWWYVASYGIPFNGRTPEIGGINVCNMILVLAIITAIVGAIQHLKYDGKDTTSIWKPFKAPIAIITSLMLIFEIGSFVVAAYRQRDSFSWFNANMNSITKNACNLADYVLTEPHPNQGLLKPLNPNITPENNFNLDNKGFTPQAFPDSLTSEQIPVRPKVTQSLNKSDSVSTTLYANGSTIELPYGLDNNTTPVLGNYQQPGIQSLTTGWYELPPRTANTPLITLSASGFIAAQTPTGYDPKGAQIQLDYGQTLPNNQVKTLGTLTPIDIGPTPTWRNLRFPTKNIPPQANTLRMIVKGDPYNSQDWVGVTPPRMSQMVTANQLLGTTQPGLIDWVTTMAFPCQRSMRVHNGIAETPTFRISADYNFTVSSTNTWQNGSFGGPNGIVDQLFKPVAIPTYLDNDWTLDWGSIELLNPIRQGEDPILYQTPKTRWGWWLPSPIRSNPN